MAWVLWKTTDTKILAQGYKSGILEREPSWKATVRKSGGKWKVYVDKKKQKNPLPNGRWKKVSAVRIVRRGGKKVLQVRT